MLLDLFSGGPRLSTYFNKQKFNDVYVSLPFLKCSVNVNFFGCIPLNMLST